MRKRGAGHTFHFSLQFLFAPINIWRDMLGIGPESNVSLHVMSFLSDYDQNWNVSNIIKIPECRICNADSSSGFGVVLCLTMDRQNDFNRHLWGFGTCLKLLFCTDLQLTVGWENNLSHTSLTWQGKKTVFDQKQKTRIKGTGSEGVK
jgi:hypothetical protein